MTIRGQPLSMVLGGSLGLLTQGVDAMFKAEITKGFKYDEVKASSILEIRLGLADAQGSRVRVAYAKGRTLEFATHAEYKAFAQLAKDHGGAVRCVGLPARPVVA